MSSELEDENKMEADNSEVEKDLQNKLYFVNQQLQLLVKELPSKYQQRLSNELTCTLAECLLDDTVMEIIFNLSDMQQLTEDQLFKRRQAILHEQGRQLEKLEQCSLEDDVKESRKRLLVNEHERELFDFDRSVVVTFDEKKTDQQHVLNMAGVPGFEVTDDPRKIETQMNIIRMILRLHEQLVQSVESCEKSGQQPKYDFGVLSKKRDKH